MIFNSLFIKRTAIFSLTGTAAGSSARGAMTAITPSIVKQKSGAHDANIRMIDYAPLVKRAAICANSYVQTDTEFHLTAALKAARAHGDRLASSVIYEPPQDELKMGIDAINHAMFIFLGKLASRAKDET